ncbi:MAG: hypothetical protein ABJE47_01835 [bacterium]
MRALAMLSAAALLCAGVILGYISIIALRRGEGVFLPAGYVSVACLAGGAWLLRYAARG